MGGICVIGAIARTATNIRAGARGPIAGMLHSAFVLLFVLVAAPLASYIPLAALAGLLAVVAWNMVEKEAFATLLRASADVRRELRIHGIRPPMVELLSGIEEVVAADDAGEHQPGLAAE